MANGDAVSVEASLTLLIGNGQYDEEDVAVDYSDDIDLLMSDEQNSKDDFEEVEE